MDRFRQICAVAALSLGICSVAASGNQELGCNAAAVEEFAKQIQTSTGKGPLASSRNAVFRLGPDQRFFLAVEFKEYDYGQFVTMVSKPQYVNSWSLFADLIPKIGADMGQMFQSFGDARISKIFTSSDGRDQFRKAYPKVDAELKAQLARLEAQGRSEYEGMIADWMAPVLDDYQRRRGWSAELRAKLQNLALDMADRSTWVTVYQKGPNNQRTYVGAVRLIASRYARIRVATPGGRRAAYKTLLVKEGHADSASLYQSKGQGEGFYGLDIVPPEPLPMAAVFVDPSFFAYPTTTLSTTESKTIALHLAAGDIAIESIGRGVIYEPGSLWKREGMSPDAQQAVATEVVLQMLRAAFEPGASREEKQAIALYSYFVDPLSRRFYQSLGVVRDRTPPLATHGGEPMQAFSFTYEEAEALLKNPTRVWRAVGNANPNALTNAMERLNEAELRAMGYIP